MSNEDQILAELKSINQNLSRGSPFASGTATAASMGNQLAAGTQSLVTNVSSMAQGTMNLQKAVNVAAEALGIFPGIGPALAGIIKATSGELESMNNSLISAGKSGVTFGQNIFAYTAALGQAGISMQTFNQILASSSKYIMGMGLNAQDSAKNFLEASAVMRNIPDVIKAEIGGIDFSEFQQALMLGADLQKYNDMKRADATQALVMSSINATIAIDDMARITGRSRQEIQKDVDQASQSRLMEVAKMSMSQEQLAAMQKSMPFYTSFGKGISDVFQQLEAFGDLVTPEAAQAMAGFNQAFPGIEGKMREMVGTLDPTRRKEIENEIMFLMGQNANDKNAMEQLRILALQKQPWAVELTNALIASQSMTAGARARYQEAQGDQTEFNRLTRESEAQRSKLQELMLKDEGSMVSQVLRTLDRAVGAGNTAVANWLKTFEQKTGENLKEIVGDPEKVVQRITQIQGMTGNKLEDLVKGLTGDTSVPQGSNAVPGTRPNLPRYDGSPENPTNVRVINESLRVNAPVRLGGTRDASDADRVSKWFENFGSGRLIQGDRVESMVRFDQRQEFAMDVFKETGMLNSLVGNLMSNINTSQDPSMMRELVSTMEKIPSQIKFPEMPRITAESDEKKILADLLDKLNTKIEKLTTAVEDGSRGTVKAVKSQNNLIA